MKTSTARSVALGKYARREDDAPKFVLVSQATLQSFLKSRAVIDPDKGSVSLCCYEKWKAEMSWSLKRYVASTNSF